MGSVHSSIIIIINQIKQNKTKQLKNKSIILKNLIKREKMMDLWFIIVYAS